MSDTGTHEALQHASPGGGESPSPASASALAVLLVLAVVSPWAFGSAPFWVRKGLNLVALATSLLVLVAKWRAGLAPLPPRLLWPLFGLVALGAFQLVPLPPSLHFLLASGSAEIWHPREPAAAAVIGHGARPISVLPAATVGATVWVLGLLSLVALATPALASRRVRRGALAILTAGGLAVGVYGVVARVAFGSLLFGRFPVPTASPFGPFVSKNHFAAYVGMAALLALGLATGLADRERQGSAVLSWTRSRRAVWVFVTFVVGVTLALTVLASQSRGGAVALTVGLLAFLLLRAPSRRKGGGRNRWTIAALTAITLALLAALPPDARSRLTSIFGAPDASAAYRVSLWSDALRAWRASPWLGQGLGAFSDILPRYKTSSGELRIEHAEND